jgi:hypothetical protein
VALALAAKDRPQTRRTLRRKKHKGKQRGSAGATAGYARFSRVGAAGIFAAMPS